MAVSQQDFQKAELPFSHGEMQRRIPASVRGRAVRRKRSSRPLRVESRRRLSPEQRELSVVHHHRRCYISPRSQNCPHRLPLVCLYGPIQDPVQRLGIVEDVLPRNQKEPTTQPHAGKDIATSVKLLDDDLDDLGREGDQRRHVLGVHRTTGNGGGSVVLIKMSREEAQITQVHVGIYSRRLACSRRLALGQVSLFGCSKMQKAGGGRREAGGKRQEAREPYGCPMHVTTSELAG